MADYIYLLQNRLTPAQWRAVEAVREAARTHGMPVFLVGGAVRDLTSGTPVRDLDFAVQGEAGALTAELETSGATVTGRNELLSSVYLTMQGGVRAEMAPTVSVSYPKPGRAEVQPATILDDLRRRDFTVNAMAVSLNEGSYGLLLDPLNGTADLENRELRLVSAYGFIEQPALLLRAARLTERLGFRLEERTESRYQTSKEEGHIQAMPAADRGYELEEIFHEEDPPAVLEHMRAEGWGEVLFAGLRPELADRAGMDAVRDLIGQLEGQGIHPDPSAVYFPLVTAKLSEADRTALKALFARPGFARQIETLDGRSKELAGQLTAKAAALPSESWRLLHEAEPEVVLLLGYHSRSAAVQGKLKGFLKEWPQMRQKIPYALMQEMRITPDLPGYDKLLDDLFFALIDGKLETVEATRAFLEPYSPPAPPQVTVRRRPAKAARGRSKKAAARAVSETEDAADAEDAEESPVLATEDEAEGQAVAGDEEAELQVEAAPAIAATPMAPVKAEAAPAEERPTTKKAVTVKKAEKAPAKASKKGPAAPVKAVPVKTAPVKTAPVKATAGKAAAVKAAEGKPTAPAKGKPAGKASAVGQARSTASQTRPAPAKATAKTRGTAAKAGTKASTKKGVAKKAVKAPVKVAPKKAAVKVVAGKAAAAKKQATKAKGSAAAKRPAPAKAVKGIGAAKKAAAKKAVAKKAVRR